MNNINLYLTFISFFIILLILYFYSFFRCNIESLAFRKDNSNVIIYIISLLDNQERTKNIKNKILNSYNNFPTYLFPAVNGKELTEEEKRHFIKKGYFTQDYFTKWNKGQQGCAASHLLLLKDIAENGDPNKNYIIIEDDAFLKNDFESMISKVIKESQNINWDQIILHNDKELGIFPNTFIHKQGFLKKCRQCIGTVAYMVTKDRAQRILKQILPLKMPIDEDIRFKVDKQFGLEEPIIHQGKHIKSSINY